MAEIKKEDRLTFFQEASNRMIGATQEAYEKFQRRWASNTYTKKYSTEDIVKIIEEGSLQEQKELSRNFFYSNGIYQKMVLYYATLLKYSGLLIPSPSYGVNMADQNIQKRIFNATGYIDKMNLPVTLTECAINSLVDGCYYGVIIEQNKKSFTLLTLPSRYCNSNFKDVQGNDIIEFDLTYFDSIMSPSARASALEAYPDSISSAYYSYKNGGERYYFIPTSIGVCFSCAGGRPMFLNAIIDIDGLHESLDTQRERDKEELRKILIQKIPHVSSTGELVFDPQEAEEMHKGAVNMLASNRNISVLTTYADVETASSKSSVDNNASSVDSSLKNIYNNTGVSGEVLAATGSGGLKTSIQKDISIMMYLANKFANWVSKVINDLYGNSRISFKYTIFPITEYNKDDFVDESFKMASSGFSFLLPALGLGISQKDLVNLKSLEEDVMGLSNILKPLQSSYTQSGDNEGGAPTKEDADKTPSTIETEKSKEKGGTK